VCLELVRTDPGVVPIPVKHAELVHVYSRLLNRHNNMHWSRCCGLGVLIVLLQLPAAIPFLWPQVAGRSKWQQIRHIRMGMTRIDASARVDSGHGLGDRVHRDASRFLSGFAAAVLLGVLGSPEVVDAYSPGLSSRILHHEECGINRAVTHKTAYARSASSVYSGPCNNADALVAKQAAWIEDYQASRRHDLLGAQLPAILPHKRIEEISMPVNMLLAFCASSISTVLLHPVDTIKARLQLLKTNLGPIVEDGDVGAHPEHPQMTERGPTSAQLPAAELEHGRSYLSEARNLYTGVLANIAREGPSNALYLAVFEQLKVSLFRNPLTQKMAQTAPILTLLLAGALGDAVGCVLSMPAEIIKRRLQTGASPSYMQALVDSVASQTARATTRTVSAAVLMRDIPEGALQIMLFETWRGAAGECFPLLDSFGGHVMLGVAAGAIAAVVTTPMDVVVTNLAAAKDDGDGLGLEWGIRDAQIRHLCPLEVMQSIAALDGWSGLMKGCGHRAAYYGPIAGIFFACFSAMQEFVVDEGRVAYLHSTLVASLTSIIRV
jgi:hypothetical protein